MEKQKKTITLIAAMTADRSIGLGGRIPWHLPAELKHFKAVTMGKPVVMGRRTWESIGKVLPGRQNIVVSRNVDFRASGCDVCTSLQQAVAAARGDEVMVIGGGELYRLAMPLASRMILTLVDCVAEADTWFPDWDRAAWALVSQHSVKADARNLHDYRVQEWVRK